VLGQGRTSSSKEQEAERRIAELEAKLAKVSAERDALRRAYDKLVEQLALLKRRIFVAKAERIDVRQLEIEFAATKSALVKLATELGEPTPDSGGNNDDDDDDEKEKKPPTRSKGRRDLRDLPMPEERIELLDDALEGKAERIGFEESCRLGYRRGGPVRIVVARATYKKTDESGTTSIVTVEKPKELFRRALLAPSLIAHILVAKYRFGLPFVRLSKMLGSEGIRLDDGTMCRYAEDAGATLGAIVDACADEARRTAFCLATDATGVSIQPEPLATGGRQPCRKGHFFVVLADKDHVFFEYKKKHSSAAVCDLFRGFSGYLLADASAVYDALFRGEARSSPEEKPPDEVGCWSHARRHYWEAAVAAKDAAAREALLRIRALFKLEEGWAALPPSQRLEKRQLVARPLVDHFFAWVETQYPTVKGTRSLLASALGYSLRQREALRRYLQDGRLPMTNNASERALRSIAVGRKAWLFMGSDDHAQSAANLFSLIASCQLHGLDPETYLTEIFRVMPHWPSNRYLELAPKYWTVTRARLRQDELQLAFGRLSVPPPPAEQVPAR
jgi:transposase